MDRDSAPDVPASDGPTPDEGQAFEEGGSEISAYESRTFMGPPVETPGDGGSGAAQSAAFLSEHEAEEDAKYNSMTDEQREAYYVRPSFLTRVKQFFKGV